MSVKSSIKHTFALLRSKKKHQYQIKIINFTLLSKHIAIINNKIMRYEVLSNL